MTEFSNRENTANQTKDKIITKEEIQRQWKDYISQNGKTDAVVIEITNFCPNECPHCYANLSIGKNNFEMSSEVFETWLNVMASDEENRPEQIWLVGGEPTEHPFLGEYLEKIKEFGFHPMLVTTGEKFSDFDFSKNIIPKVEEIDITIRAYGSVHNLFMLPKNKLLNNETEKLKKMEPKEQIVDTLYGNINKEDNVDHFKLTVDGLLNISKIKKETGVDTKIGLNIDLQAMTDLYQIIAFLNDKKIPVENIIIQIQTFSEKNQILADIIPNIWRKPNIEIIKNYYEQAQLLIKNEIFKGKIEIIDPIPDKILDELKSKGIELGSFYNPVATPAVNPFGKLRSNVIL